MSKALFASGAMLLFSLTGCTLYRDHPPTMEADPALTGGEGIALVNQLQQAFEVVTLPLGGSVVGSDKPRCDYTLPQHQEYEDLTYVKYTKGKQRVPDQFRCIVYKKKPTPEAVRDHLDAGFGLTDLYCDIFFRRIARHSSDRRFARSVVNDVGAGISAVLGLTNTSAAVTGGIGAGFGIADSSFRNYDDAFLVSADLPTLQAKVLSEQEKFRAATASKKIASYVQANTYIIGYARICSYVGMRGLINASLAETTDGPTALRRMLDTVKAWVAVRNDLLSGQSATNLTSAEGNAIDDTLENATGNESVDGNGAAF